MPAGKGTYGKKVGRPPKKIPGLSPLTKAEKRSAAYKARAGTKSTTKRGSRTRRR